MSEPRPDEGSQSSTASAQDPVAAAQDPERTGSARPITPHRSDLAPWQDGPHAVEADPAATPGPGAPLGAVSVLTLAGLVVLMVGLHYVADVFGPAFLAFSLVIAVRPLRL